MNDKQKLFAKEYLKDLNATQAAKRAGYSEKTASVIGYENLTKPYIADYVATLMEERCQEVKVDSEWVLKESVSTYRAATTNDAHTAAVSALNLIGKHVDVRALIDRNEHTGKDGGPMETKWIVEIKDA